MSSILNNSVSTHVITKENWRDVYQKENIQNKDSENYYTFFNMYKTIKKSKKNILSQEEHTVKKILKNNSIPVKIKKPVISIQSKKLKFNNIDKVIDKPLVDNKIISEKILENKKENEIQKTTDKDIKSTTEGLNTNIWKVFGE